MPIIMDANSQYRGIGAGESLSTAQMQEMRNGWWHNWSTSRKDGEVAGYIPTLWGKKQIGKPVATSAGMLFTFNEPDQPSQANLTPGEIATLWREVVAAYPNHQLVAPTPSHAASAGFIDQVRLECIQEYGAPPNWDALSVNSYLSLQDTRSLLWQYQARCLAWGISKLYVKEFNFASVGDLGTFLAWADSQPLLPVRLYYGYFLLEYWPMYQANPLYTRPLYDASGQLTVYGERYRQRPVRA